MKKVCFILIVLLAQFRLFAQDSLDYQVVHYFDLKCGPDTKKILFKVLVPADMPHRQRVLEMTCSAQPLRIFNDGANSYAEFELLNPAEKTSLTISYKTRIWKNDYASVAKKGTLFTQMYAPEDLLPEKYIEADNPAIMQKAKSLASRDTTKMLKNIYEYVAKWISYKETPFTYGALKAFENRWGDCTEFASLFVALCRANGIPARVISGLTTDFGNTPFHNWAEVYMHKYGWVAFDPTVGNDATFKEMKNKYIYLSNQQNDKNLNHHYFYAYKTWGDHVQTKSSVKMYLIKYPYKLSAKQP